ncbi:MAG TPA: spherulation-specific family 4 protein [Candidatus Nitrosotalea sp.]|nr:spherulation-specific family 4 protein [Candidatus Nitrosotalea sp.]
MMDIPIIFSEMPQANVPSPLKQIRLGVLPESVTCNSGLYLLIKSSDHLPACVRPGSIARLTAQGWTLVPGSHAPTSNQNYSNPDNSVKTKNHALGLVLVPYFDPADEDWQTIYSMADKYPGAIRYVIINPCSGPCDAPLSSDWQHAISILKSDGVKTLGYIFDNSQSIANIDYYMKNPKVPTDGIFFDNEGSIVT